MREIILDFIYNVLKALAIGAVTGFITYLVKLIKNKIFEKKFLISGEYLVRYKEKINDVVTENKATAKLKQRGSTVKGKIFIESNHEQSILKINGKISEKGHLQATFFSNINSDSGTLFLKKDRDKAMTGHWIGYDSNRNEIFSRTCDFFLKAKDIKIIPIEEQHITDVYLIANDRLGQDFISIDFLKSCVNKPEKNIGRIAFDSKENKVVGFTLSQKLSKEELKELLTKSGHELPKRFKVVSDTVGFIYTTATDKKYSNRGVGFYLVVDIIEYFEKENILTLYSVQKKNNGTLYGKGLIDTFTFRETGIEIEEFWKQGSIENHYSCKICRGTPCTCNGVLIVKGIIKK